MPPFDWKRLMPPFDFFGAALRLTFVGIGLGVCVAGLAIGRGSTWPLAVFVGVSALSLIVGCLEVSDAQKQARLELTRLNQALDLLDELLKEKAREAKELKS